MKKSMFIPLIISLVLVLSACGSVSSSKAAATASGGLSMEGQLLVGTFKLESTSLAVTAAQADQLLPLWETLQSLASSGTAASQEVDAVVSQIQSTMSTQQVASISAMNLTLQDLAVASADTGTSTAAASSTSSASANPVQPQAGAGMPTGGNPPADMGGGMPGASTSQTQASTTQAVTANSGNTTSQVPAALINSLVEMLQKKVA